MKETLEQTQKPVAWRTYTGRGYYIIDPTFEDAQKNWPDKQHQPLYTAPPQRKPLTLEQRQAITELAIQGHEGKRDAIMWAIVNTERHHDIKE